VRGLLPVAALRFREALAGRILWLLPLHFVLALLVARSIPGTTGAARIQAADAAALALAALLALVAAAILGAGPLPAERERARGTLVLAAPVSAAARVLGTALGTGTALLLLVLGLGASSMAAVDLGAGLPGELPRRYVRSLEIEGGEPDPREEGLVWITERNPTAVVYLDRSGYGPSGGMNRAGTLVVEARARVASGGAMPGEKKARFRGFRAVPQDAVSTATTAPFRLRMPLSTSYVVIDRVPDNFDLGLRTERIRVAVGSRSRALGRALHAGALLSGLLAVMAAALAVSTFAGSGVAAAAALALSLLALFRQVFVDAAATLAYAGAMERAVSAEHGGAPVASLSATPPAMAPVFRALAAVLPDGTRFDLAAAVAANEVPDPGDAGGAVFLGCALAAGFLVLAVLGAGRRP
jgi:hypothetical protein